MDDPLSELQALTSKRSSLRDKLKKRREALGSILAQTTESNLEDNNKKTSEESTSNIEDQAVTGAKKSKLENDNSNTNESHHNYHPAPRKRNSTSASESKQDLMSLLQASNLFSREILLYK